ncbi:hypothetical protein BT93_B0659 [Corymbia citriodora subsp. variegata]|nr:hypothetical protein BT93_B0659 [Corymbia citriodora subsp. variegata]
MGDAATPLPSSTSRSILIFVLVVLIIPQVLLCEGDNDVQYTACSPSFNCGTVTNVSYPFWGGNRPQFCGLEGFELECHQDKYPIFEYQEQKYGVLKIDQHLRTMTIVRMDLMDNTCLHEFRNTSMMDSTLFNMTPAVKNLSIFFGCLGTLKNISNEFEWLYNDSRKSAFFMDENFLEREIRFDITSCVISIIVPVLQSALYDIARGISLQKALNQGFNVQYSDQPECLACTSSGGLCGSNSSSSSSSFTCYCCDKPYARTCNHPGKKKVGIKVAIGVSSAVGGVLLTIGFFIYRSHQKKKNGQSSFASRSISSTYSSRTDFEKGSVYRGLHIFDYDELKKATNNFDPAEELGDGGFGTVFKGKLRDGRVVAVKRLYESNYKRVEQFVNEVEILTRLRHPNLVSLYGCTSRQSHRLLLVYEYVPNGTVADHINGDSAKPGLPPWSTRLNIAIETANALVYLHASDVIHRDVKTNNILLNENFSVKVADFGLSRLFPFNVTHVSTAPQGTPGYVDPEYHQCYQLTEKSDVYSFGVVLMELISSLPAVDITRHRHEINLSALATNKIRSQALHELVDQNLGFDTDYRTGEMITAVAELGFQCLQESHEMRPSMNEVLDTLKDIQNRGYNMEKSDKMDNASDDAVLLKNNPLTLSPDSVTVKWLSDNSTPNASG